MPFLTTLASLDLSAVDWAEAIGRLHPMLLHMPIGLIVVLAILEFPHLFKKSAPVHDTPRTVLVTVLAVSSMASATAGWLLHEGGGYGHPVEWHEWLGVGLAFLTVAIAIAYWRKSETYTLGVIAAFILVIPTAHLGATMTHGEGFLTDPWLAAFADEDEQSSSELADGEPGFSQAIQQTPAEGTEHTGLEGQPKSAGSTIGDAAAAHLADGSDDTAQVDSVTGTVQEPVVETSLVLTYADIAPVFRDYCVKCHGTRKRKGDLALHSLESILAGGEHGAVIVPGDPLNSKLITSLSLPLEDEHHMPPEGKRQPSADAIAQLTLWVQGMDSAALNSTLEGSSPDAESGAEPASPEDPAAASDGDPELKQAALDEREFLLLDSMEGGLAHQRSDGFIPFRLDPSQTNEQQVARYSAIVDSLEQSMPIAALRQVQTIPEQTNFAQVKPSQAALDALSAHQVHVESLGENSTLLRLDFTAAAIQEQSISSLIAPIAGIVGEVCLYGQSPTSNDLTLLGMMPNLKDLDLRSLRVQPFALNLLFLNQLRASTSITSLNLSSTPVSGSGHYDLAVMQGLKRVHLWGAGIPGDDLRELAELRPELAVLGLGIERDAAIEVEPEVAFTKYVPEPGADVDESTVTAPAEAVPENKTCPVSNKPVVPAFTVVHEGRTIGFCCANCPKSFVADPAKYLAILDKK
ncbi:MAG: putative membrane protein [Planctomycetota bacterium]|jgi:uncharacterized membrane protein